MNNFERGWTEKPSTVSVDVIFDELFVAAAYLDQNTPENAVTPDGHGWKNDEIVAIALIVRLASGLSLFSIKAAMNAVVHQSAEPFVLGLELIDCIKAHCFKDLEPEEKHRLALTRQLMIDPLVGDQSSDHNMRDVL